MTTGRLPVKFQSIHKKTLPPLPQLPIGNTLVSSLETLRCLAIFDPIMRKWFHISRLTAIVAIGLRKPYAKSESGANLGMYDVY
jgi:hypothetical protein